MVCYTYTVLESKCLVLLIVEVGVWRDVEVVGVGDVLRGLLRGRLCGAMSILIAVAWAHAMPMAGRL
jgi:hypothetical protein